jgi:hypothetical protein
MHIKGSRLPKAVKKQPRDGVQDLANTLAQKVHDLEAEVKALGKDKVELLKVLQEWVKRSEGLMQETLALLKSS